VAEALGHAQATVVVIKLVVIALDTERAKNDTRRGRERESLIKRCLANGVLRWLPQLRGGAQIKVKGILLQSVGRRYRRLRVRIDGAETGHLVEAPAAPIFLVNCILRASPRFSNLLQRR
jgi:hypothetical protein